MKNLKLKLKNFKLYLSYKKRIKGERIVDNVTGTGFYLQKYFLGIGGISNIKDHTAMLYAKDGEPSGMFKLLDYANYRDPNDQTKWASWQLLYIEGVKPIAECTWEEFYELYHETFYKYNLHK